MVGKRKRAARELVQDASFGWLGTLGDLALVMVAASVALHGAAHSRPQSSGDVLKKAAFLFHLRRSKRLQKSLRHALYHISQDGLCDDWLVTEEGYRRLKDLMPNYIMPEERNWDGSIFLVIYDIPENLKKAREQLRRTLKTIDFGMLQESVWVGFSDPQHLIRDEVEWNELNEFVLISKIGPKDGYLTREKLVPIIQRSFKLRFLNQRYQLWLDQVNESQEEPMKLAIRYLAVLRSDPQLPSKLLPPDWVGDKAFEIYQNKIINQLPHRETDKFINLLSLI